MIVRTFRLNLLRHPGHDSGASFLRRSAQGRWRQTELTSDFRRKLGLWFCSLVVVALAATFSVTGAWFRGLRTIAERGTSDGYGLYGATAESLVFLMFQLPIITIWHLADFAEHSIPQSKILERLTRFRMIFLAITLSAALNTLIGFGVGHYSSCDALPEALFYQCKTGISWLMLGPWALAVIAAFLLTMLKVGHSLASQLDRLRK